MIIMAIEKKGPPYCVPIFSSSIVGENYDKKNRDTVRRTLFSRIGDEIERPDTK